MARACALLVAVCLCGMQSGDVARPVLLKHHKVWSASDLMFIQVRIVPDSRIRTVALEAWELEREPIEPDENGTLSEWVIPIAPKRIGKVRASVEDGAKNHAVYRFEWKAGLTVGDYELVAVLTVAGGKSVSSVPSVILVR